MTSSLRVSHVSLAWLWAATLVGCGGERLSAIAVSARQELHLDRPQAALDKLAQSPKDNSAGAHYLRAVAHQRLEQLDASKSEIQLALEAEPKNPKFLAFNWRLKLFDGDDNAIEPLIEVHDKNSSAAAVALFAVYAYQAKLVRLRATQKVRAARIQLEKAEASIKTALSLAAEIPELHSELIGLAIWFGQPSDALRLLEAQLRDDPDNLSFLRTKVQLLRQAKRPAEAIQAAAELFRKRRRTESAAHEFADTLDQLPPSPAVISEFIALSEQFPDNLAIRLRHAWSLGKSGQATEACELLTQAFEQQTDERSKRVLAQSLIAVPLTAHATELAVKQFQQFSPHVRDETLLTYFSGELAMLRGDHETALKQMQSVVESFRRNSATSPLLARQALRVVQRLLAEKTLADQIRLAAELTLQRAGLDRIDESELRDEARNLLQLLETVNPTEAPPPEDSHGMNNKK